MRFKQRGNHGMNSEMEAFNVHRCAMLVKPRMLG